MNIIRREQLGQRFGKPVVRVLGPPRDVWRVRHVMPSKKRVGERNGLEVENVSCEAQLVREYSSPQRGHIAYLGARTEDDQTAPWQRPQMGRGDQTACLGGEREHGREDVGVRYQAFEVPFSARARPVKTGIARKGIPRRDVCTHKARKTAVAAGDVTSTDDPHPFSR